MTRVLSGAIVEIDMDATIKIEVPVDTSMQEIQNLVIDQVVTIKHGSMKDAADSLKVSLSSVYRRVRMIAKQD